MSTIAPVAGPVPARPGISTFERYLTLWVALCIVAGIGLGSLLPGMFATIAAAEVARVNLVVAVLIWLMIIPMLLKIDFGSLGSVRQHWKGVGVTLFINWAVKPFSMAALGTFFIGYLFAPLLPAGEGPSYIAGLILLAAAPCTAMVFVWSTYAYFQSRWAEDASAVPRFLWNAKMRFGKTFTSYQLAKKLAAKRVLVVTFKPAVEDAWRTDLESHVDFDGWQYLSKSSGRRSLSAPSVAEATRPVSVAVSLPSKRAASPTSRPA